MGLETGTTISDLDETWPLSIDAANTLGAHVRLIKQVLRDQFPGQANNGFTTPIVATETELNYLSGTTDAVQSQINTINTTLTSLQSQITALDVRITALENA